MLPSPAGGGTSAAGSWPASAGGRQLCSRAVSGARTHQSSSPGRGGGYPVRARATSAQTAAMIRSVASWRSSSSATVSAGPIDTAIGTRPRSRVWRPGAMIRWVPHRPTGTTGAPLHRARRAAPVWPARGSRSRDRPPSGKMPTHSPQPRWVRAAVSDDLAVSLLRATGMWPSDRRSQRGAGARKSSAMARNRTRRPRRSATEARAGGSKIETWLAASRTAPRSGMCSSPVMRQSNPARKGRRRRVSTVTASGSIGGEITTGAGRAAGPVPAQCRRRDSPNVTGGRERSVGRP